MKNVTFETAVKLKEAGFPQPTPQRGQSWYNSAGVEYIITLSENLGFCDYSTSTSGMVWFGRGLNDGEIFSPTATDILQHLPGWALEYTETGWVCYFHGFDDFVGHRNPAEAAAEAWTFENNHKTATL